MSERDLGKAVAESIRLNYLSADPVKGNGTNGTEEPKLNSGKVNDKLVVHHRPRSMESEYFRFLKSKIEQYFNDSPANPEGRIILVTGASVNSGKTTCALNLALVFAKAYGNRALFLDADTRNSNSAKYLGLKGNNFPGLSEVLEMEQRAGSVLINTGLSNMIYFPSGKFTESFIDRLRSEELAILLQSLKKRFRYTIIDTPPAFPMPESGILSHHSDGVILVIGAGMDGQDQLNHSMEALHGSNIIGVVLNRIKTQPLQKYASYGYYTKSD